MKLKTLAIATSLILSSQSFAHDIGHEHEHVEGGWNAQAGFVSDVDIQAKLWSPRGKSKAEIAQRAAWLAKIMDAERSADDIAKDNAFRKRFADAIVINSVLPNSAGIINNTKDHFEKGLIRNRDAGVTMASATVYAFDAAVTNVDGLNGVIRDSDDVIKKLDMIKVDTVDDIRNAKAQDRMAVMYNTQGADFVIDDLSKVDWAQENGVRAMNFVYNQNNALAGGGAKQDMGVTELGYRFIQKLNQSGVIVDVSHSSDQTTIDAAKVATRPIIASHSNVKGVHDVSRNMSDEAVLAVGSTGGVVCSTGIGLFISADGDASPENFAKHVVYTANLIGKDKTCFSSDYVHNYEDYLNSFIPQDSVYPPELGFAAPMSSTPVEQIWSVARVLQEDYGWNDQEIRGFLGENLMRVYSENWNAL